jgi:hypothetical protein
MSRKTACETVAVVLALSMVASSVRAEHIKLTDAQMDSVTAGAFTVGSDPNILLGFHNAANVTLQSSDNGITYVSGGVTWTTQVLYISTTQGYAVGVLSNPQGQFWDGGFTLPPNYLAPPLTQTRGVLVSAPMG